MVRNLCFIGALLLLCCSNPPVSPSIDPTGVWSGVKSGALVSLAVESNKTYGIDVMVPPASSGYQESGTWELYQNALTLSPLSCKEYDTLTGMLQSVECKDAEVFTINGPSMTLLDGSVTLSRRP